VSRALRFLRLGRPQGDNLSYRHPEIAEPADHRAVGKPARWSSSGSGCPGRPAPVRAARLVVVPRVFTLRWVIWRSHRCSGPRACGTVNSARGSQRRPRRLDPPNGRGTVRAPTLTPWSRHERNAAEHRTARGHRRLPERPRAGDVEAALSSFTADPGSTTRTASTGDRGDPTLGERYLGKFTYTAR